MGFRYVGRDPECNDTDHALYDVYDTDTGFRLGTAEHVRTGSWKVVSPDGTFTAFATNREAAGWALRHEYEDRTVGEVT
jgi:hypothetical protein